MKSVRGFSLVELIIVVALIGVLLTMAVLSLPDSDDKKARQAMQRVQRLIELGQEEALNRGQSLGLAFWQRGYQFYRLNETNQWTIIDDDKWLRPHTLDEQFELELYIDGLKLSLPDTEDADDLSPQLFMLSSGEVSAFELEITASTQPLFRLTGNVLGQMQSEAIDAL